MLLLLVLESHSMPANTLRPLFYRRTTFSSAKLTNRPIAVTITQLKQQNHAQHLCNSYCSRYTHTDKQCMLVKYRKFRQNVICTCFTIMLASAAKKHVHKGILADAGSCNKGRGGCTADAGVARPNSDAVLGDVGIALCISL